MTTALRIFIGSGLLLSGSLAFALPSAERYSDVFQMGERQQQISRETQKPIFLRDNDDDRLFYAPYDRVTVNQGQGPDGEPAFGLTYDERGGFLSFTVRAAYSAERLAYMNELRAQGNRVQPLMPIAGGWSLTATFKDQGEIHLAPLEKAHTVFPDVPVAMSVQIPRDAIGYVVKAYETGASLGVNYHYQFRATLMPLHLRAFIHWNNFRASMQRETKIAVKAELQASTCALSFCFAKGKASFASRTQLRKLMQTAIERQEVQIQVISGGGNDTTEGIKKRVIDEVLKVVLTKEFTPVKSTWAPEQVPEPSADCSAPGGALLSGCFAAGINYTHNSEVIYEDKYYTYEIISQDIVNLDGMVGSSFSYMCRDHPEVFIHIRTGEKGCPVRWNDTGIHTEAEPGQPRAKMPDPALDSLTPPMTAM